MHAGFILAPIDFRMRGSAAREKSLNFIIVIPRGRKGPAPSNRAREKGLGGSRWFWEELDSPKLGRSGGAPFLLVAGSKEPVAGIGYPESARTRRIVSCILVFASCFCLAHLASSPYPTDSEIMDLLRKCEGFA